MSRVQCRCGRKYYSMGGTRGCPSCDRGIERPARYSPKYSEIEELQVLSRARRAERVGVMPTWRVVDTPNGLRYQIGQGSLLTIEQFDFRVAEYIRRARKKLGYKK